MSFSSLFSSELILVVIVLGIAVYNLYSTRKEIRKDREKALSKHQEAGLK